MRSLLEWFRIDPLVKESKALRKTINNLIKENSASNRDIEILVKDIERKQEDLEDDITLLRAKVRKSIELNAKMEAALEVTQEQVRTANEIVIPGLVAANKLLTDRWQHESKILAMKTAFATAKEPE